MKSAILTVLITAISVFGAVPKGVDIALMEGWNIVIAEDAIPSEIYAAKEFQSHFKLAGGVELSIVRTIDRPDRHVFIGPGKLMRYNASGFDTDQFGDEDLRIVVRNNNIVIAGGRPRGTLYGVYNFLEDYLGIRFLTPEQTHIPPLGKYRYIGPVDRFYSPPLCFRSVWAGRILDNPVYAARVRDNTAARDPGLGGRTKLSVIGHSFLDQLTVEKYGKDHPEYFSLVDGKRQVQFDKHGVYNQLCLTNPDVLSIVTESVLAQLKARPDVVNIAVSQNDGSLYCRCPDCVAIDQREESHMGSLLAFVNSVADEVAKQYPDVLVGTLAYGYSRKPPAEIKPRPNVQIQLCTSGCCQLHPIDDTNCPMNVKFCKEFADWSRICNNVAIWTYNANYCAFLLPWPNLRSIGPNVKYFVAKNTKAMFMAVARMDANFSDLRNYILASMLWDPSRNGEQLMEEFLTLHYGEAAPAIRRYLDLIYQKVDSSGHHLSGSRKNCRDYGIDEATIKTSFEIFDEAMNLAENETIRARVEKASICVYRAAIEPVWRMKTEEEIAELDPELVERMRPIARRLKELTDKYGIKRGTSRGSVNAYHERMRKLLDL